MHLGARAQVEQVALGVLGERLGFAGVEPECPDPVPAVTLRNLFPHVAARLGVGRVVEAHEDLALGPLVPERHVERQGPHVADQQPTAVHLVVIFAVRVYGGPDRDHKLDTERAQFVHHGLRVGPLCGVELPLALAGPMEEVDDDH